MDYSGRRFDRQGFHHRDDDSLPMMISLPDKKNLKFKNLKV